MLAGRIRHGCDDCGSEENLPDPSSWGARHARLVVGHRSTPTIIIVHNHGACRAPAAALDILQYVLCMHDDEAQPQRNQ